MLQEKINEGVTRSPSLTTLTVGADEEDLQTLNPLIFSDKLFPVLYYKDYLDGPFLDPLPSNQL